MKKLSFLLVLFLIYAGIGASAQERAMQIHRDGAVAAEYKMSKIDSVKFGEDSQNRTIQIYRGGIAAAEYQVSEIDSITFIKNAAPDVYTVSVAASPVAGGTVSGGGTYSSDASCTVTATANSAYIFTNWTENGAVVSTEASYSFPVSANRTLVANFAHTYLIDGVEINGVIWATRNVDAPGTFAATPESAGMFYQWNSKTGWSSSDPLTSSDGSYWRTSRHSATEWERANDPCPAGWRVPTFKEVLSLYPGNTWTNRNGVNGYIFGAAPNTVFLPAAELRDYPDGASNTYASYGYYWSSTQYDGENANALDFFNGNAFWTDHFNRNYGFSVRCVADQMTVEISASPAAGGTVSGDGTYSYGEICTVSATPNSGYDFINWTEDGAEVSTDADYSFELEANRTLVANFTPITYTITYNLNGGSGVNDSTYTVESPDITLPTPAWNGYSFEGWYETGDFSGTAVTEIPTGSTGDKEFWAKWKMEGIVVNGVKWATCNVDAPGTFADAPESAGMFYQWNRITGWSSTNPLTSSDGSAWDISTPAGTEWESANDPCPEGWRVPTRAEQQLLLAAGGEWTTQNGINGLTFGLAPDTVFLPAAGDRYYNSTGQLGNVGIGGYYWSDTQYNSDRAYGLIFLNYADAVLEGSIRAFANSVRCVSGDKPDYLTVTVSAHPDEGGTASGGEGTYSSGESCTVSATPADGYTFVSWTENDAVVSTDANYTFNVSALATSLVANFVPNVIFDNGVAINGIVWATSNVDAPGAFAASPEEAGMFYQWNKKTGWSSSDPLASSDGSLWDNSIPSVTTEWETANDPCPSGWRVPSYTELVSLYNSGHTWETQNGIEGNIFGQAPNTIFMPAAGDREYSAGNLESVGYVGRYWGSTGTDIVNSRLPWFLMFNSSSIGFSFYGEYGVAQSVRCVADGSLPDGLLNITVSASPTEGGTVSVSGSGYYFSGDNCTVTATPADGYTFAYWTNNGMEVSTDATYQFTVSENSALVASFVVDAESVEINGIKWATRNVDAPGTFADAPESAGMFYQWNSKTGWSSSDPLTSSDGSYWRTSQPSALEWERANDPCPAGWRVPTFEEFFNLFYSNGNVNGAWTIQNGVNGYLFGDAPNTVFLPAAGYRYYDSTLYNDREVGFYWTNSAYNDDDETYHYLFAFDESIGVDYGPDYPDLGSSVRCVQDDGLRTVAVSVNPAAGGTASGGGTYSVGTTCTLTATANSGYTFINWAFDGSVVSTDASITFEVLENHTVAANFALTSEVGVAGAVEINGVKWATLNVDAPGTFAATPESAGMFYQWNRKVGWSSINPLVNSEGGTTWDSSLPSGETWEAANDPCPEGWRMPTKAEQQSLLDAGSSWTTQNGIEGRIFGAAPNTIFLPAANNRDNDGGIIIINYDNTGFYWSSTNSFGRLYFLLFDEYRVNNADNENTKTALSVRCVADERTVTVSSNPAAGGSISGGGSYMLGTSCTLTATANSGYAFVNWTENGAEVSTEATYQFSVTANRTLVANFARLFTVTVSSNPTDGGTLSGGGDYLSGTNCTLTATVNSGYTFVNWTENGSVVSTEATYQFSVTANRTLVANFDDGRRAVDVSSNPAAGGTTSGGGRYTIGTNCTVTATANNGYTFANWTENGTVVSTETSYTFEVSANCTLVANFVYSAVAGGMLINGVIWATCNVDEPGTFADSPESTGMFYQWGSNIGWSSSDPLSATDGNNTWRNLSETGTEWASANDPCPAGWRVPTSGEIQSLLDVGAGIWTKQNGINGRVFGTSPNTIFLPAAGNRNYSNGGRYNNTVGGRYWINTQYDGNYVYYLYLGSTNAYTDNSYRSSGYSVRCVKKE
jgi:uncharacterized protein (TIGR02145 family)/uncharacterized repeat protein (TIGR02543 family)